MQDKNINWGKQLKDFDTKAVTATAAKEVIIPAGFNAEAYLQELMHQLPGREGKYELSRQLAAAAGRKEPWSHVYLDNVNAGRQPFSKPLRRALFWHSIGQFSQSEL